MIWAPHTAMVSTTVINTPPWISGSRPITAPALTVTAVVHVGATRAARSRRRSRTAPAGHLWRFARRATRALDPVVVPEMTTPNDGHFVRGKEKGEGPRTEGVTSVDEGR